MILSDYIKDILNDDNLVLEYVDGKYMIEIIIDCLNSHAKHSLYFSCKDMFAKQKTDHLSTFISKDLFEIKCSLINTPKREPIDIFGTGSTPSSIYLNNE
jgi:hypothetical protein